MVQARKIRQMKGVAIVSKSAVTPSDGTTRTGKTGGKSNDTRVFRRLALMVGVSSLCLLPYTIVLMIRVSGTYSTDTDWLLEVSELVTYVIGSCNNWINPVIYAWKFDQFRQAFKDTLCTKCKR